MKTGALILLVTSSAFSQGTFQNLNFESANPAGLTNLYVAFSDAFPGWTGYIGTHTSPVGIAGYNFISGGSALITLITPTAPPWYTNSVIAGNYTATIAAGLSGATGALASASIAQIGTIPINARSIRFSAQTANYLSLTFNGTNVPFFAVSAGPNYNIYAGDVGAFAGLTGELRFTEQAAISEPVTALDNIEFSPLSIPEPSSLTLAVIALGILGLSAYSMLFCQFRRWQ